MLVKDFMSKSPVCLDLTSNLETVNYFINFKGISGIPVTENEKLVGIVTKTDLVKKVIYLLRNTSGKQYTEHMMQHIPVYEIMTPNPVILKENDPIQYAIEILLQGNFHSLVVVNDTENVVGIVTSYDLLQALHKE